MDEIQVVPEALLALRYFYEMMPELHVIAAGSLLDFAIEKVGIPVGRVQSLYMFPLSFEKKIPLLLAQERTSKSGRSRLSYTRRRASYSY